MSSSSSSAYPFAGYPSAQSSSHHHPVAAEAHHSASQRYDPHLDHHHQQQQRESYSHDSYPQHHTTSADDDDHDDDHDGGQDYPYRDKDGDRGAAPPPLGGTSNLHRRMTTEKAAGYNDPYSGSRGNSIWTRDDKRSFAERSAPAKIFRVLFCILIVALIFILSIICLIVMFVRPPNVAISGVGVASQAVQYSNGAFSFDVKVDISVSNPNSISATIKKLAAKAYDANDKSTTLGSGEIRDQRIVPHANTTIGFPFTIAYDSSKDTDLSIITDIANKCGLNLAGLTGGGGGAGQSGNLNFDLDIDVDVSVLSITIPVSFSHDVSFPCPLTGESVQSALGSLLNGVSGGRGSLGRRDGAAADADERQERRLKLRSSPSQVELVAAAANALVKRYAGRTSSGELQERTAADVHDAL